MKMRWIWLQKIFWAEFLLNWECLQNWQLRNYEYMTKLGTKLRQKNTHKLWKSLKEIHHSKSAEGTSWGKWSPVNYLHGLTAPLIPPAIQYCPCLPWCISYIEIRDYVMSSYVTLMHAARERHRTPSTNSVVLWKLHLLFFRSIITASCCIRNYPI